MSEPDCDVTLEYYSSPTTRFSYYCNRSSAGWSVQQNGSIHPPSRSRIVRFHTDGYPQPVVFGGFQLVSNPADFPPEASPWHIEPGLGVTSEPAFPPPSDPADLTLTFAGAVRTFYRLAVRDASNPAAPLQWDEPRIYNDGDE